MKKVIILSAIMLFANSVHALTGSGTEQDPFLITSLTDFDEFAGDPNFWDDCARLETNLDLTGRIYTTAVIAPDTNNTNYIFDGNSFTGTFDGNNHTIYSLDVNGLGAGNDFLGLFGSVGSGGQIMDLGLENVDIIGSHMIGGLVGYNYYGMIENCYATGDVNGYGRVGGLVGWSFYGMIENCYAESKVTGKLEHVGGLVGYNSSGRIENCYAESEVTGIAESVGGLCGENFDGIISKCYATGQVNGEDHVGGLVGSNRSYGTISNCYASGSVTGDYKIGGLVGFSNSTISDCNATGQVNGNTYVGGLVGFLSWGTISYSFAESEVMGSGKMVGGLVGSFLYSTISNCYASGSVTGYSRVGGLVGDSDEGIISDCFAVGDVNSFGIFEGGVGGLVGMNRVPISNCFSTGAVNGSYDEVGGLVGLNWGPISNSYAIGMVTSSGDYVGGLVGRNSKPISNSYARGMVTASGDFVGGLVGANYYRPISNCYATGGVDGYESVGGLVGWNYNADIFASFWDTQTTGEPNGVGLNEGSGTVEVYGRTTAQMQTESTFTDYGWDFVNIWGIDEGVDYPRLLWEFTTIFVDIDATGINNGRSWANAYKYLQDALDDAQVSGKDIWVAAGTYYPDANTSNPGGSGSREAAFPLINGVGIYGGFAGGETSFNERDWQINETILSGDIGTPDVNTDNSYHVVTGGGTDPNAVLDGFTITAGNANRFWPNNYGGGMYNYTSSPTVSNCTFSGNSANYGGGMCNYSSSPTVTGCTFTDNSAVYGGGGMYNYPPSNPIVISCTFRGNSSDYGGGGGMLNSNSSNLIVTNCTFSGNSAGGGGGMYNSNSSTTVTNCTFSGNSANGEYSVGGGMLNINSSTTVTNCTFIGNSTNGDYSAGGGMRNSLISPTITNCTFSGNSADMGGGMSNWSSSPTVTNCILWGNSDSGGTDESAQISNSSSTTTINYSCVQGWTGVLGGVGNIGDDPLFIDADGADNIAGTEDDDLRLLAGSPCIDAGDNSVITEGADLGGNPRIIDGDCNDTEIVDMGAYEFNYAYIGDFDGECDVDFADFAILGLAWLTEPSDENWNQFCDISIPADNKIDWADVEVLSDNWLAGH